MMIKQIPMQYRVAQLLAQSLHGELNGPCPEESWSGALGEGGMFVIGVSFRDGELVLSCSKECSRKNGFYELHLKPVEWSRVKAT